MAAIAPQCRGRRFRSRQAGAVPIAFLVSYGMGVPATFVFKTLVMLAVSAGYVAVSRHVYTLARAFS
jgi:hypothetical protein